MKHKKCRKNLVAGDGVKVSHMIFGTLNVRVMKQGEDDNGTFWIGRVDDDYHMSDSEPVKFRIEDVME